MNKEIVEISGSEYEQNEQAAKFYQKMGFYVINRSERDNEGKPYPILHLALKEQ
jgi:putative acetyltransferase